MFTVQMTPATLGDKTATLTIDHNQGTGVTEVPLDGNGYGSGSGTGGSKDRQTYYACSAGDPAALWPIALAAGWLARRRRRR